MQEPDLKPFFRQLGAELRKHRGRLGLTQEDMIGHGFSARHWQQIEAGRPITLKTLVRACTAFGIMPSQPIRSAEGLLGKRLTTRGSRRP